MKICPKCQKTYSDESLNFCLNDGTILTVSSAANDPPPTVVMDNPRRTNPNFSEYESNFGNPNQQIYQSPFAAASVIQKQDQTLPVISLILGVFGIILICCYAGFPLGAAAIVTGYLGLSNANKDPMQYGGRSMAIGGIVLGAVGILITLGWILVIIISSAV
jgi:hypothetical protein